MVHVWVEVGEASGREQHHLGFVELVAHSYLEVSRKNRDVLAVGMPMRGDLVAVGHFEADGEVAGLCHGIAFEHSQAGAGRHEGRSLTPLDLVRGEGVLRGGSLCQGKSEAKTQRGVEGSVHEVSP